MEAFRKKKIILSTYLCFLSLFSLAQFQIAQSDQSEKFTMDSIVSFALDINSNKLFRVSKSEYKYDSSGRITYYSNYSGPLNSTQRLEGKTQTITKYNGNGLIIQSIDYLWDSNNRQWVEDFTLNTDYNQNNQPISRISLKWNKSNQTWENNAKVEFLYDANQRNNFIISSVWNSMTKQWEITNKDENQFDANGNVIFLNSYIPSQPGGVLEFRNKTAQTFDAKNNLTSQTKFFFDLNLKQWIGVNKSENDYDSSENKTLQLIYKWDTSKNDWIYKEKYEYKFNATGKQTSMIHSLYGADKFYTKNSSETIYDTADRIIKNSTYDGGSATKTPYGNTQYEVTFNPNGVAQALIYYTWDFSKNDFIYSSKYEYSYNPDGSLAKRNLYQWNTNTSIFELKTKTDLSSLNNGNLSISIQSNFNEGSWQTAVKNEKEFNLAYPKEQLIYPLKYESLFDHMLLSDKQYTWEESWKLTNQTSFYFSKANFTSVVKPEQAGFKVFPNPASEKITIQLNDSEKAGIFELFNVIGKKITLETISNSTQLDVNNIPPGTYFYQIKLKQKVFTGKIIIQ